MPDEMRGHHRRVIFDGEFVMIQRTGFLGLASNGKRERRIPVSSIVAVRWKPAEPFVYGVIQFTLPDVPASRSPFERKPVDAVQDENTVVFTKKQQPAFEALRARVETAVAAAASPGRPAPIIVEQRQPPVASPDHGTRKADLPG